MDTAALVYHREAFLAGQWWLPFTAQVAHFNTPHALANLAAAVLLFWLFRSYLRWQQQAFVLAGGILGVALVVVLDVHCSYYAGASGALYGWAAGGSLLLLFPRAEFASRKATVLAFLLFAGLALRWLSLSKAPDSALAWGFPIYAPAHGAGFVSGAAAAFLDRRLLARVVSKHRGSKQG